MTNDGDDDDNKVNDNNNDDDDDRNNNNTVKPTVTSDPEKVRCTIFLPLGHIASVASK